MRHALNVCLALLLTAASGAQTAAPAPHAFGNTAAQPSPSPTPTLQTRTNLVVVDVVVTDRSGHNVHGLHQSDFAVTEDAKPQAIRSFDEHVAPAQQSQPEPALTLPPGVFSNYTPVPHTAALNVLLLDTLNTPLADQGFVREQLLRYIRTAPPEHRIAIFGLTSHLIYLQGFTSDPALLRAAIDKKSVRASKLLGNPTTSGPGTQISDTLRSASAADSHGALAQTIARLQQFDAQTQSFQIQLRTRYTLDAMNALAHYLSGLPGRKNLIWFSGSFPISILPDANLPDPFAAAADLGDELRDTTTLLTRSQVAVYPVDARGLFNVPAYDPSERGSADYQDFNRQFSTFNQQTILEHSTMREMAEQTGGHAFINTNGLKEAVTAAITTGANFYTLTYSPSNTHWNNAYRRISVRLESPAAPRALTLAYRRGYFAVDPDPPSGPPRKVLTAGGKTAPAPASDSALRSAMMRGAPDSTAIIFKARVLPAEPMSTRPEAAPDPTTRVNSDPKLAHGPWRAYTIDLTAPPTQLLTRAADGSYSGIAEFITHCYDANGVLVSAASQAFRLHLSAENANHLAGTGLPLHQLISIPDRGEFFLRIGVHNLLDNRVGSLEVPISAIKNLPPAASSPAATSAAAPSAP